MTKNNKKNNLNKLDSKKLKKNNKAIAVVGLGYVGLPLALLADRKGYRVIGVDINKEKVDALIHHDSPFLDEDIQKQLLHTNIQPTTDTSFIHDASIIIICVPTPVYEDHTPNLEPLRSACENVSVFLKKGQLVILESTVNPGVCETVVFPILEQHSGLRAGIDFDFAHCPERINPGDKEWSLEDIPRVIAGVNSASLKRALSFYKSILKGKVTPMKSLQEAEAVKIVENTFRDVNIAFVNELALSFSKLGIDVVNVINGASTKPFGFMPFYPGGGVGGHCIPVDPYYLIKYAEENGFNHKFLSLAREINENMPNYVVDRLEEALQSEYTSIRKANVAVLGLAYKPDVDDPRESPALEIVRLLNKRGANVSTYDPYIMEKSTALSLHDALSHAQAAVVATAHESFRTLSPHDFAKHGIRIVIDGRNCLPKEDFVKAGVTYRGVGR